MRAQDWMRPGSRGKGRDQTPGDPKNSDAAIKGTLGHARSLPYLETSSFDAPVEFIVLSAPAPEAVGHPVALTQRQAVSVTCPLLPGVHSGLLLLGRTKSEPSQPAPFLLPALTVLSGYRALRGPLTSVVGAWGRGEASACLSPALLLTGR